MVPEFAWMRGSGDRYRFARRGLIHVVALFVFLVAVLLFANFACSGARS
jgi:hypothetical protein